MKPFSNVDTNKILGDRFIPMRNSIENSNLYTKSNNIQNDKILESILPCKSRLLNFNKEVKQK